MSDDLLYYYERELAWLRNAGAEFAESHPKIASNLRMGSDIIEDPHVSRLIESVAFLNARIQSRLDNDFPELTNSLLENLQPHYLAPLPSMTIVDVEAADGLDQAQLIPNQTLLETERVDGIACRFSTIYPVLLTPYKLHQAKLVSRPFTAPGSEHIRGADSLLAIHLHNSADDFTLGAAGINSLCLHIKPSPQHAWPIYDMLTNSCLKIVIANSELDPSPIYLDPSVIKPIGFGKDECVFPSDNVAQPAYRLLTEFFHYPNKFLFLEISGLADATREKAGDLILYFYLSSSDRDLERNINKLSFSFTATPAVNLFPAKTEPFALTETDIEYPLVVESRNIDSFEIYSIQAVKEINESTGASTTIKPFFGLDHSDKGTSNYWQTSKRIRYGGKNLSDIGHETLISVTNREHKAYTEEGIIIQANVLSSNRNLPSKLPYGGGQPLFSTQASNSNIKKITSLMPPSPVVRPDLGNGIKWRLISHLNLNFLSLTAHPEPVVALREMLRLYDFQDSATTRAMINAIDNMRCSVTTSSIMSGGRPCLCRGIEISLWFDETLLAGQSVLFYASMMEQFFTQYVSLNSFIKVIVRLKGKDQIFKAWPPRVGSKTLL